MVGSTISNELPLTTFFQELRKQTFELMALLTLPAKATDDQRSNLAQMAEQVEKVEDQALDLSCQATHVSCSTCVPIVKPNATAWTASRDLQ
jgi:hypothetical protein